MRGLPVDAGDLRFFASAVSCGSHGHDSVSKQMKTPTSNILVRIFRLIAPESRQLGCVTEESNEKPARWEAGDQAPQHTCFFGMLWPKQS